MSLPKLPLLCWEKLGTGMTELCQLLPILCRGCRCVSAASSHPSWPAAPLLFRFPGPVRRVGGGANRTGSVV